MFDVRKRREMPQFYDGGQWSMGGWKENLGSIRYVDQFQSLRAKKFFESNKQNWSGTKNEGTFSGGKDNGSLLLAIIHV